jgi:hypothetical protein
MDQATAKVSKQEKMKEFRLLVAFNYTSISSTTLITIFILSYRYYSWKQDGKTFPKTFTDDRVHRLNELGFEWRLKDSNNTDNLDTKMEAIDTRRQPEMAFQQRQPNDNVARQPRVDDMMDGGRYEPYRANIGIYEQRGWV